MKTYVLTVSRTFPKYHKRAGDETFFVPKILLGLGLCDEVKFKEEFGECLHKIHTIRSNHDLWRKRIYEIQIGKAILSLRYWSGKPYNSKQIEFLRLGMESGIGIQKIDFSDDYLYTVKIDGKRYSFDAECIAESDGLNEVDFEEWFKGYDMSKPMAIIHFTKYRY